MPKDWTGNNMSVFSVLGTNSHSDAERETDDYYATPPYIVEELLKRESFNTYVWEPAVGGGHVADILKQHGHNVKCSDIIDRKYPNTEIIDFLHTDRDKSDYSRDIITNPPYKLATEFVQHALDISMDSTKVAMFLKIQFLETKKRYDLFKKYPPKKVYVCVERVTCGKNGIFAKESSAVCYAWFVWEKGYKGPPIIDWIF